MIEISEELAKYAIFISFDIPNKINQKKQLATLKLAKESFLKAITKIEKNEARKYPDISGFVHNKHMILTSLIHMVKKCDEKVSALKLIHMKDIIKDIDLMYDFISLSESVCVYVIPFLNELKSGIKNDKEYMDLRERRRLLMLEMEHIASSNVSPNYLSFIQTTFKNISSFYDEEFQYTPPSEFDSVLEEYIHYSPMEKMIAQTATVIAEGETEEAMYAIGDFCEEVYKLLNIVMPNPKAFVYAPIIRILFDEAYCIGSELNKYREEDEKFLIAAHAFSKKKVRDLKLTSDISIYSTPGLPLTSLFKQKQIDMLKQIELMTNPLDIMKQIHSITVSVAQFFGSENGMLSFDDMLTLMLALLSIAPPANCISISRFINRWRDVQLNDVIGSSKDFFIAAVETLCEAEKIN